MPLQAKIMKHTLGSLLLLCGFISFGQHNDEKSIHCHKRDANSSIAKSNSLSVEQIAETEKYDVTYYHLDITMDNLSTDVSGTGEIYGIANFVLDSVLFELFYTFNISEIRFNDVPTTYNRTSSRIKVPVNLLPGESFKISVDYDGTPPTAATNPLGGAGMTNDSSPSWGNQVTWSLSEPFSAYEWWPCKQSLKDKADSVSVFVTVPNNCKAGSNGILENVVDLGNGNSRYEWKHRKQIDYYLVSVAVAEYIEYNVYANPVGSPSPILIQNFIYNNPGTLPNFQADIDETVDFIELYSELYGLYPFHEEKYGHCMAPLSGGMEHQTMTTQGWFDAGLTSHELGHQWWGNNVTCASWADIWVNEGFASYSEYLMLENLYPGDEVQDMADRHTYIMSQGAGSVWVEDSLNEGRIFDGRLTYDKGAAIIHTFRYIINDDALFFQALKQIQEDFKDSVASGLDIRDYMSTISGVDLTDAYNEWYFGEGFPVYSVRWNQSGNDLMLEVSHTTTASTPLFTTPLELKFIRNGVADTIIRVPVNSNLAHYYIPNIGELISLSKVDPQNAIINQNGTIVKDLNFVTSINEIGEYEDYLKVYPNPSNGVYNVVINAEGNHKISIYDTKARKILVKDIEKQDWIDLSALTSGYYILHVENQAGERRIETLIKE